MITTHLCRTDFHDDDTDTIMRFRQLQERLHYLSQSYFIRCQVLQNQIHVALWNNIEAHPDDQVW